MNEKQRTELLNAISLISALKYEGDDFKLSSIARTQFMQELYESLLKILDAENQ